MKKIITIQINNKSRFSYENIIDSSGYNYKSNKEKAIDVVSWFRKNNEEDVEVEIFDGKETTYHYVHISITDGIITITDTDL